MFLACLLPLVGGCGSGQEKAAKEPAATVQDARGAVGTSVAVPLVITYLPEGFAGVRGSIRIDGGGASIGEALPGAKASRMALAEVQASDRIGVYTFELRQPDGGVLPAGDSVEVLRFTTRLPDSPGLLPISVQGVELLAADGTALPIAGNAGTIGGSYISNTTTLFAFLASIVGLVYLVAQIPALKGFFRYLPPLIWMYFIPMMCTTIGITPDQSSLYSPFFSRTLLPAILVLLLIPSDVRSIMQLGPRALVIMLTATTGIVLGAVVSFGGITWMAPGVLPAETWKGVAALSGSWIGGSPNMFAVLEIVGTPAGIIGPLVVVDTVVAYSWLGLLIALSSYQVAIDKRHKADRSVIDSISIRLEQDNAAHARAPRVADIAWMLALAFGVSQICLWLGNPVFTFFTKTLEWEKSKEIINAFGWGILIITAVGLLLSTTPIRKLDYSGASSLGTVGLYLLLTGYGAQANLRAVLEVPAFFLLGIVWLLVHVIVLYIGVRLTRSPLFLGSTSSMANIGGTASAPVVAAAYNPSMAPVGLLMAILGSVLGTPLALFIVAPLCRMISGE